jgi:hypothetical protein
VPVKPNQEVVMPPLPTWATRPASPAFFRLPANMSTRPDKVTLLWAWAAVAQASSAQAARRDLFMVGSR